MKRKSGMLLCAAVLMGAVLAFGGCGSGSGEQSGDRQLYGESIGTSNEGEKSGSEDGAANDSAEGYSFISGDAKITPDMDIDEALSSLSKAKSVFEAPSCAGEGISYLYDFGAFEVETYPAADGKNRVGYITLKDDTVATPEGIDLSMNREDVIRAYGEDYDDADNMICYEKQGSKLKFIFEGENIISIEYASAVIG